MNTRNTNPTGENISCAEFGDNVSAWLDDELSSPEDSRMDKHVEACANCSLMVSDLIQMLDSARGLPTLSPSRDLWSEVESRLDARVVSISSLGESRSASTYASVHASTPRTTDVTRLGRRSHNRLWLATAATVLVAVTAGVTWTAAKWSLATTGASTVANAGTSVGAKADTIEAAIGSAVRSSTPVTTDTAGGQNQAYVIAVSATSMIDVDAIYEKEIAALRRIVNERFTELDSTTVRELKGNLATIDRAIADSRRALQRDPGSALLSSELDRTIEAKLVLMRRVALL